MAVVDYAIVHQDLLPLCDNLCVIRASELFHQTGLVGCCDTRHNISDHSLLCWNVALQNHNCIDYSENDNNSYRIKYDVTNIPGDFMCYESCIKNMNEITAKCSNLGVTESYKQFCVIMNEAMSNSLRSRKIILGKKLKQQIRYKPWWSDILTELWNIKRASERRYCKSNLAEKSDLRNQFICNQKTFDRAVSDAKREHWKKEQHLLEMNQSGEFWKQFGKVGMNSMKSSMIPWEIVVDNRIITDKFKVLEKWKMDFELLLNPSGGDQLINTDTHDELNDTDNSMLNLRITTEDIKNALNRAKRGKATGNDDIPIEVLNNDLCISYMVVLFNTCFSTGTIPEEWSRGIINPILKNPKADARDPNNYRGITITSSVYKLYCQILNHRLTAWSEINNVLCDEQNGFRPGRCTIDHASNLTNVLENRLKKKLSTFAAFIDFSKAYDRFNRELLWHKLSKMGISGRFLASLQSLYKNVKCTVRVNGQQTDWFEVNCGLKQGCILSPMLFNLFINDLTCHINDVGSGISVGDTSLSILLYADDIVLMADSELKLQSLLTRLDQWCKQWGLVISATKSKVMHFRTKSVERSKEIFQCGETIIEFIHQYKYLGLIFSEHLDMLVMVKMIAQSASRALGLLIAKDKALGGMPYQCFSKCYDAIVQSTLNYGAPIYGTSAFSCIDAVQNRACRYFLGLGKYAPNTAINGDMGWPMPQQRQWICVIRHWCKLTNMNNTLLTKRIFTACSQMVSSRCKTWFYRVGQLFVSIDHAYLLGAENVNTRSVLLSIEAELKVISDIAWKEN